MAFPSVDLFPADNLFPQAFTSTEPPPPINLAGQESLALDGMELNDGNPWWVMKDPAIDWTPPKKKLNWVESPLSDGAALVGPEDHYENAELILTIGSKVQQSKNTALQLLNTLTQKLQQARRTAGGLPLTWTPSGASMGLTYYVVDGEYEEYDIHREEGWFSNAPTFRVHLYLRPFGYGVEETANLGYSDQFVWDSVSAGPWRYDTGAGLTISTGQLTNSTTSAKAIYLPYQTGNAQAAIRGKLTSGWGNTGVLMKRSGSGAFLMAGINLSGSTLHISTFAGGSETVRSSVSSSSLVSGSYYWIAATIEDDTVFAGVYPDSGIDTQAPLISTTYTLSGAFGVNTRGQFGIYTNPTSTGVNTGLAIDSFRVAGMTDVTSNEPVACVDLPGIKGDVEAEARQVVRETSTVNRNHHEWGLESSQFDNTITPPYLLDSDSLTAGSGTHTVVTGFSDPNNSGDNGLTSSILSTTVPVSVALTGAQRHVGAFKVKARVVCDTSGAGVRARLAWRTGEGSYTNNDYCSEIVGGAGKREIDLGQINIVNTGLVNQTWDGKIQAYCSSGSDGTLAIDYLMLIPIEKWGVASNPVRPVVPDTYLAFDHFTRNFNASLPAGGNANLGGAWAHLDGTGMGLSGVGVWSAIRGGQPPDTLSRGNKVALGTGTYSAIQVQADTNASIFYTEPTGNYRAGVFARWSSVNDWVAAFLTNVQIATQAGPGPPIYTEALRLQVYKSTFGGGPTSMGSKDFSATPAVTKTIILNIDAGGYWQAYAYDTGGKQPSKPTLQGQDAVLVTGAGLGTGRIGLYDAYAGSDLNSVRSYDNFIAFAPPIDAVLFASRELDIRSDSTLRESSSGGSFGRVPRYFGDRFFIPPAGDKHHTARLAWKLRRSDVDGGVPDITPPAVDNATFSISYTPRYLLPPGATTSVP